MFISIQCTCTLLLLYSQLISKLCVCIAIARKYVVGSFATVNIVFFAINITSSFVCPKQDAHEKLVILRVVVNGLLFVVVGVVLCLCIIKVC